MNDDECAELIALLRQIHLTRGYTIILIEHHMNVVMELCANDRIVVLNVGKILTIGSPVEIQNDPQVIRAYLGETKVSYASQHD
jgi:branched-chain amino acid transport system ATP-binding protein